MDLSKDYKFSGAVLKFFLEYIRFGDAARALGVCGLFDITHGVDGTLDVLGMRYGGFADVWIEVQLLRASLGGREIGTFEEERKKVVGKLGDISDRALKAGDFGNALRGVELEAKIVDVLVDKKHVQVDTNVRNMGLGSLMKMADVGADDLARLGVIDGSKYKVLKDD